MPRIETQKDYVKTALRLPPGLHSAIRQAAAQSERGFNAEVLFRLRCSIALVDRGKASPVSSEASTLGPVEASIENPHSSK